MWDQGRGSPNVPRGSHVGRFFDPYRVGNLLISLHFSPETYGFESRNFHTGSFRPKRTFALGVEHFSHLGLHGVLNCNDSLGIRWRFVARLSPAELFHKKACHYG